MCPSKKSLWELSKQCWDHSPEKRSTVVHAIFHLSKITTPTEQRLSETVRNLKRKIRKDSRNISFASSTLARSISSPSVPMLHPTSATQPSFVTHVCLRDDGMEDGDASIRHRKEPSSIPFPLPHNRRSAFAKEVSFTTDQLWHQLARSRR